MFHPTPGSLTVTKGGQTVVSITKDAAPAAEKKVEVAAVAKPAEVKVEKKVEAVAVPVSEPARSTARQPAIWRCSWQAGLIAAVSAF